MLTSIATATTTRGTTATSTRAITRKRRPRAERPSFVLPVALTLVAGCVLAAVGGAYDWSVFPSLLVVTALFLISGARVAADPLMRRFDVMLLVGLGIVAVQIVPLPASVVAAWSPSTLRLQDAYALEPITGWRTVSIHPAATRTAFAIALTGALTFWAGREILAGRGLRAAVRVLGWVGAACSLVALGQHVTAPTTIYWLWHVADPRAVPFGPFIDRNHLATWLVLTICVVTGRLAMRVTAHMDDRRQSGWLAAATATFDGDTAGITASIALMCLTLTATLSRSGFAALVVAAAVGTGLARHNRRHGFTMAAAAALCLVVAAIWTNGEGLVQRVQGTLDTAPIGRLAIWRETLPIIRDFPLLGTGAGTFADAMLLYQRTTRQVLFNHAHDEYLQLATEGGVVLLLSVVAATLVLYGVVRRRLDEDRGPHRLIRVGAAAGLIGVAVQSIWDTGLHEPANLLLAALVAAIAVRPNRADNEAREPRSR